MKLKVKKAKALKISKVKNVLPGKSETKNKVKAGKGKPPVEYQWKPGQSGNPKGRERKLVSTMLLEMKAQGVEPLKASQIIDCYETMLNMTMGELKVKALDESQPAFVRIIIKGILSNKGNEILEKMLDRAHGRATQKSEIDFLDKTVITVTRKKVEENNGTASRD